MAANQSVCYFSTIFLLQNSGGYRVFFGALLYIRAFNGFISMHFAKSEIFLG